jgi:hypothetical protein
MLGHVAGNYMGHAMAYNGESDPQALYFKMLSSEIRNDLDLYPQKNPETDDLKSGFLKLLNANGCKVDAHYQVICPAEDLVRFLRDEDQFRRGFIAAADKSYGRALNAIDRSEHNW